MMCAVSQNRSETETTFSFGRFRSCLRFRKEAAVCLANNHRIVLILRLARQYRYVELAYSKHIMVDGWSMVVKITYQVKITRKMRGTPGWTDILSSDLGFCDCNRRGRLHLPNDDFYTENTEDPTSDGTRHTNHHGDGAAHPMHSLILIYKQFV
jgi:hypothetical protein